MVAFDVGDRVSGVTAVVTVNSNSSLLLTNEVFAASFL